MKGWKKDGLDINDLQKCSVDDESEKLMHILLR